MDIKFHCDCEGNFRVPGQLVRGFSYRDYSIEPHTHEFYEMNIILKGRGTHCLEDACFPVQAGDVFVIPPTVVHAYCDTQDLEVYHILLHKDFIAQNQAEAVKVRGYLQLMEIEPFLRRRETAMFLHLTGSKLMQLQSELSFLDDSADYDQALKNHAAWKTVYWLSRLLVEQMEQKHPSRKYDAAVLKALEYIHSHYEEKLTDEILCRQVYLSRSTFLRSFRSVCGCSPAAYIRTYRRNKAAELLQQAQLSKTQIAHACGFYDLSHMERSIRPQT